MGYKQGQAERAPVGATERYLQWETTLRKANRRLNIEISFQNATRNCVSACSICTFKHYLLICLTHAHTHTHICLHIHTRICVYIYIYIYIYIHTHIYIYMYTHFHRNTFTHCPVHLFRYMMPHQTLKCHTNAHIQIHTNRIHIKRILNPLEKMSLVHIHWNTHTQEIWITLLHPQHMYAPVESPYMLMQSNTPWLRT
jgi:hypothetical protein